eukprot:m.72888 g.72888  ORF g.72888 m.72888 type:complete len:72 (+) comp14289_c0_seq7:638-853(+)
MYSAEWHRVARAINAEAANMEKLDVRTALGKLIITDSWIVQCHLYTLDLALIPDSDLRYLPVSVDHSVAMA